MEKLPAMTSGTQNIEVPATKKETKSSLDAKIQSAAHSSENQASSKCATPATDLNR